MNKEINRRKFLKWVGIASVSAGFTLYSKPSFSNNMDGFGRGQMNSQQKVCPHNFCRYYQAVMENSEEIGVCTSSVYCRR